MPKYLITTPIYYANAAPHIGSAYTTLVADVLARAHRQIGEEVLLLTGTDEHGAKIAQKAAEAGLEPQQFVDQMTTKFQETWQSLGIELPVFARTTDGQHIHLVGRCMQQLYDKKLIAPGEYEGWYCVSCEEYKDVEGENPVCEIHNKPLERVKESIYYFALSKYRDQLIQLIESDELKINPIERKNEVLAFLKGQPLRDIPVTRSKVAWGVPVPFDPEQTVYVWFDALLYYLSFSSQKSDSEAIVGQQTWWPADFQLLGKDILRFHAVIWPALLLALELPTPKELFVHGFFTINGAKMSKTTGNVIAPQEVIDRYGRDAARYLIISAVPFGADGDISFEKLDAVYASQLSNGLGNLLQRTIVLINKFGIRPQVTPTATSQITEAYRANDLTNALAQTFQLVDDANRYLASEQPWSMENDALRETVLVKTYEELLKIAHALEPVMPEVAARMKQQLDSLQPEPLFPRLT
jgi:methionyl-tRNA synthetase